MKKVLFLSLISLTLGLTSCLNEDDPGQQYYDLGIVTSVTNGLTIVTDSKDTLYSYSVPQIDSYKPAVGDRLYFLYTLQKEGTATDPYDLLITVDNVSIVKIKPIITLNEVNRDTIGNDNVGVSSVWVGRDYFNVDFYFYRTSKTHYFSLVYDPLNQTVSGATVLEFRHKDNDDAQTTGLRGLISYDLRTLGFTGTAPYKIVFKYTDLNGVTQTVERTYTPDTTN